MSDIDVYLKLIFNDTRECIINGEITTYHITSAQGYLDIVRHEGLTPELKHKQNIILF